MDRLTTGSDRVAAPSKQQCNNCHSYVSEAFTRVFGDNEDRVNRCLHCTTMRELKNGPP